MSCFKNQLLLLKLENGVADGGRRDTCKLCNSGSGNGRIAENTCKNSLPVGELGIGSLIHNFLPLNF